MTTASLDLDRLVGAVGNFAGQAVPLTSDERPEPEDPAELLDTSPLKVVAEPIGVGAWVDGVQNSLSLTYRDHRPVRLQYYAAGGVDGGGDPLDLRTRLEIACSQVDVEWLESLQVPLPDIVAVDDDVDLPRLGKAMADELGVRRNLLEREVITSLLGDTSGAIMIDGAVTDHVPNERLMGVIKTVGTRWLADERPLWSLPSGWRSPRFRLKARGPSPERFSCYLRLASADHGPWHQSLIRLESFDPDLLDPLAARCLANVQDRVSGDARWDRHLGPIADVERVLRAHRPALFQLRF